MKLLCKKRSELCDVLCTHRLGVGTQSLVRHLGVLSAGEEQRYIGIPQDVCQHNNTHKKMCKNVNCYNSIPDFIDASLCSAG